jgi:hypothetical protein
LAPQLYLPAEMKRCIFEEHDFYVAQINQRVIAQFQNLEKDADHHAEAEYKRMSARYGHEDADPAAFAEAAHDNAIGFYTMLSELKQQVILGALAGLYHRWEKGLRGFIERELAHDFVQEDADKAAWSGPINDVFGILEQFGWDIRAQPFFPAIDVCRLVVNVYKHGQGPSCTELNKKYPQYLPDPIGSILPTKRPRRISHEWLALTEQEFAEIAKGLCAFWEAFPERLYLKEQSSA